MSQVYQISYVDCFGETYQVRQVYEARSTAVIAAERLTNDEKPCRCCGIPTRYYISCLDYISKPEFVSEPVEELLAEVGVNRKE